MNPKMRSPIGLLMLVLALLQVAWLGGCSVDADALRAAPQVLDAGFPDAVPRVDSVAAEALRTASDLSVPDAGLALEVPPPSPDTSPAPDLRPAEPDLRSTDVLPAPDLAPECPYVAWTRSSPAAERWTVRVDAGAEATCFTVCGTLAYLQLAPASSRVTINGVATAANPTEGTGYLPAAVAIEGLWVFRVNAGVATTIVVAGYPRTTTGACP
jgi:hypothetical protein